jgi:hypothetical protein
MLTHGTKPPSRSLAVDHLERPLPKALYREPNARGTYCQSPQRVGQRGMDRSRRLGDSAGALTALNSGEARRAPDTPRAGAAERLSHPTCDRAPLPFVRPHARGGVPRTRECSRCRPRESTVAHRRCGGGGQSTSRATAVGGPSAVGWIGTAERPFRHLPNSPRSALCADPSGGARAPPPNASGVNRTRPSRAGGRLGCEAARLQATVGAV